MLGIASRSSLPRSVPLLPYLFVHHICRFFFKTMFIPKSEIFCCLCVANFVSYMRSISISNLFRHSLYLFSTLCRQLLKDGWKFKGNKWGSLNLLSKGLAFIHHLELILPLYVHTSLLFCLVLYVLGIWFLCAYLYLSPYIIQRNSNTFFWLAFINSHFRS